MNHTRGNVTALIVNPQVTPNNHPFRSSNDRMYMYFLDESLQISVIQLIDTWGTTLVSFNFSVPGVVADGVMRTYTFKAQASGTYWAYEQGWDKPYTAVEGAIRLSLDASGMLTGDFNFIGEFGNTIKKRVNVSKGAINLSGLIVDTGQALQSLTANAQNGSMRGSVVGGPMRSTAFNATVVRVEDLAAASMVPDVRTVTGRQNDAFPPISNFIVIMLKKTVQGTSFDLANSPGVDVIFGRHDSFGIAKAVSGTLKFISPLTPLQAKGTLDCQVQRDQEPPFSVKVDFNINREPR